MKRFEGAAASDLAAKLQGPDKRVHVQAKVGPAGLFGDVHSVRIHASNFQTEGLPLFTEPDLSTRGRVGNLRIELTDFTLSGLGVRRLTAEIPDCRFDFSLALRRKRIRLSRSGTGVGEVEVSAEDLARFVLAKYPEVKRCQVRLERDKILIDGFGEFLFLATEFSLAARLEAQEGGRIVLAHSRLLLDGKPADEAATNALVGTLNPVVDLDRDLKLYGAIQVQRVVLREGLLRASGSIKIPDKPKLGK
ncbi:MAG: LmeA family phospholipid-binding protein [Fimbriimonas sp.]